MDSMRVSFCRFVDAHEAEIIINPLAVRYLMSGVPGTTRIFFTDSHLVTVRGTLPEVQQQLMERRRRTS